MINRTLKYRVHCEYAFSIHGKKQWAHEIVTTRASECVARSANCYSTKAAARAAGMARLDDLGLSYAKRSSRCA